MNPTREETDAALTRIQIETDQAHFHDLGNHNRAIARERIARHRVKPVALEVDDYTETRITGQHQQWPIDNQMKGMVNMRLSDQRSSNPTTLGPLIALAALLGGLYGLYLLMTEIF